MLRQVKVKGIIWVGSATETLEKTTTFFREVMEMPVVTDVPGFTRLAAANGDRLEFFGPDSAEHDHLDTGPVGGSGPKTPPKHVPSSSRQK